MTTALLTLEAGMGTGSTALGPRSEDIDLAPVPYPFRNLAERRVILRRAGNGQLTTGCGQVAERTLSLCAEPGTDTGLRT